MKWYTYARQPKGPGQVCCGLCELQGGFGQFSKLDICTAANWRQIPRMRFAAASASMQKRLHQFSGLSNGSLCNLHRHSTWHVQPNGPRIRSAAASASCRLAFGQFDQGCQTACLQNLHGEIDIARQPKGIRTGLLRPLSSCQKRLGSLWRAVRILAALNPFP